MTSLIANASVNNAYTVQATISTPFGANSTIPVNLIAASQGNASVTLGYNYNASISSNTVLVNIDANGNYSVTPPLGSNFMTIAQLQSVYNTYAADINAGNYSRTTSTII